MNLKGKLKEFKEFSHILFLILFIFILLPSFFYDTYFYLTREIFKNIYSGYFPFWNYRSAGGFPFFASGELNIFYFSSVLSKNQTTLPYDIILHLFLSEYFFFKLLKKLKFKNNLLVLVALLYLTSGFSLYALINDINYFHTYNLLPAIAYFLFLQFKKPHFKNLIIINFFLAQIVYNNFLSLAIFILIICLIILLNQKQFVFSVFLLLIFIFLSLPYLLSLQQLLNNSDLSFYSYSFFTKNSFAPAQYTQFFYPPYSKVAFNFLVLPLVLTYLITTKFKQKWLVALSGLSFLIASGKYGFILSLIYYLKPYFIIFANYEVFFGLVTFFIILLFAYALNYFLKVPQLPIKTLRNVYLILFLIITAIYIQNFAIKQEFFYFTDAKATFFYALRRGWHIVAIFLFLNYLIIKIFFNKKYFLNILCFLAIINFLPLFFCLKGHFLSPFNVNTLSEETIKKFKRIYTLNKLVINIPEKYYLFPTINTIYNLMLKNYFNFMKQSNLNSLKFASVGIIKDEKSIKKISFLPIYYLTNNIIYLNNQDEVLAALKTEEIKNKPAIIFTENIKQTKNNNPNNCPGTFYLKQSFLNHFSFAFNLKNNCYFVFGQTNYPGWKAYLDKKPLKIYSANYLFQAVEIPSGKHSLIFHFVDESAKLGIKISCLSLSIIILIMLGTKIKKQTT